MDRLLLISREFDIDRLIPRPRILGESYIGDRFSERGQKCTVEYSFELSGISDQNEYKNAVVSSGSNRTVRRE